MRPRALSTTGILRPHRTSYTKDRSEPHSLVGWHAPAQAISSEHLAIGQKIATVAQPGAQTVFQSQQGLQSCRMCMNAYQDEPSSTTRTTPESEANYRKEF